ncbi:hypothetical protein [Burkholderia gladioli]
MVRETVVRDLHHLASHIDKLEASTRQHKAPSIAGRGPS